MHFLRKLKGFGACGIGNIVLQLRDQVDFKLFHNMLIWAGQEQVASHSESGK